MRQVVGGVVVRIDAEPLAAEHIVRTQELGGGGILDDAADLFAREIGDGVVGALLEQEIAEGAEEGQAAALPGFFVKTLTFVLARLECRLHVERKVEAGRGRLSGAPGESARAADRLLLSVQHEAGTRGERGRKVEAGRPRARFARSAG